MLHRSACVFTSLHLESILSNVAEWRIFRWAVNDRRWFASTLTTYRDTGKCWTIPVKQRLWRRHSFPVKLSDSSTVAHVKASFKRSSWAAKHNENCSFILQCYLHGIQLTLVFHGIPFSTEKDCSVNEKNSHEKARRDKSTLNNYGYKIPTFKRLFLGR